MPWAVLGLAIASLVAFNILFVLVLGTVAHREWEDGFADRGVGSGASEDDILAS